MTEIYVLVKYLSLILMLSDLFGTASTNYLFTDSRISLLRRKRSGNLADMRCYLPQKIGTKVSFADLSCGDFDSCQGIEKKYAINGAIYKAICDMEYILPNGKSLSIILCKNGKWVDIEKHEALNNLCEEVRHSKKKCEDLGDKNLMGQDENNCITDGRIPIHTAAAKGQNDIIESLLKESVNLEKVDKDGWTPLLYAVWKGQLETVKYLVCKGANINKEETLVDKRKPIHIAAKEGYNDIIEFLLTKGVNIDELENSGWTPLLYAVWQGKLETTKYLVSKGANINKEETLVDNRKPIHIAAKEGYNTIIEFLLSKDVNVDDIEKNGWTPLHYAVWKGKLETTKYLVSKGADINKKESLVDGKKPIHIATEQGYNDIIEFLLTKGVDVDDIENSGWTPLLYAVWLGKLETTKYLVSKGAIINKKETLIDGRKPIHIAGKEGQNKIIEFLLSKDVDIDETENNGWTPLHYAVWKGKLETVKYLISEGANINKKETLVDGCKAIHIAAKEGQNDIIEFLLTKNINIDELENNGWTPLHYAVWKGHLETVRYLLSKGADIQKSETLVKGRKAIHMAAGYGHKPIVDFLLSKGANINEVDNKGWTPLRYAIQEKKMDVVTFLKSKGATTG